MYVSTYLFGRSLRTYFLLQLQFVYCASYILYGQVSCIYIFSMLLAIILLVLLCVYLVHKPVVSLLARKQCCDHSNIESFIFRARSGNVSCVYSENIVYVWTVCIYIAFFNILWHVVTMTKLYSCHSNETMILGLYENKYWIFFNLIVLPNVAKCTCLTWLPKISLSWCRQWIYIP